MAWQRKIPFGYKIQGGKSVPHPTEANAVRKIFDLYIKGDSYLTIADAMSGSGVRYHAATPLWNKNMIKRILENHKYAGEDGWPEIISSDIFKQIEETRGIKVSGCREHPACNDAVKRKLICGECGTPFKVQTSFRDGIRWWHCAGAECDNTLKIADIELEQRITDLQNRLIEKPELLNMRLTAEPLSLESERIQNELYRELSKVDWNEDYAKSLALARAAEQYEALGNMGCIAKKAAALQTGLSGKVPLTAFDSDLFQKTADALIVYASGVLALKLINSAIVTENESGEGENHADAAC